VPQTNAEKQKISRNRRARAYDIIKALAIRAGYMAHERDGEGLDRFMNDSDVLLVIRPETAKEIQ
jgi:hypothetical protein